MKVLIVQTSFLGDVVLSTPVITAARALHPNAEIWMMTTPIAASLLEGEPLLTGVLPYDKRGEQSGFFGLLKMARLLRSKDFDIVYSLHRSMRTSLLLCLSGIRDRVGFSDARGSFCYTRTAKRKFPHEEVHDVVRNLRIFSGKEENLQFDKKLRLSLPSDDSLSSDVKQFLSDPEDYVVLVPGSVWNTKRWSSKGYHEVAKRLLGKGKRVLVIGSPEEKDVCEKVASGLSVSNFSGKTSLPEVVRLIKGARVVVCNDSFAQHVASAVQTPNVVVFCATSPRFGFGPWQNRAIVVEKEGLSCKPCRRHGSKVCPTGTESCMKDLDSELVFAAISDLLNDTKTDRLQVQSEGRPQ